MIFIDTGSMMTSVAYVLWLPVVLMMFALFPARRAVLISVIGGWLFLPTAIYEVRGLPNIDKAAVAMIPVLLGATLFDSRRLLQFRPRWFDLPMCIFCMASTITSLRNGLGMYDGMSWFLSTTIPWGISYLLGRLYFSDLKGIQELAVGLVLGGLVYVPFCWVEIRMSPQLHRWIYGYHQHTFGQTIRFGGYRPMVFLQHGLMVGLWMGSATLMAFWLWRARAVRAIAGIPISACAIVLLVTLIAIKSTGAILLFGAGIAVIFVPGHWRASWLIIALCLLSVSYMGLRASGIWEAEQLVSVASTLINEDRARSLEGRVREEIQLSEKARTRPVVGWGLQRRSRITNEAGKDISTTDSMWIVVFGTRGLVGLLTLTMCYTLPTLLLPKRLPSNLWRAPSMIPAWALGVIVSLWLVDCLFNYLFIPIYMCAAGGLMGLSKVQPTPQRSMPPWRPRT